MSAGPGRRRCAADGVPGRAARRLKSAGRNPAEVPDSRTPCCLAPAARSTVRAWLVLAVTLLATLGLAGTGVRACLADRQRPRRRGGRCRLRQRSSPSPSTTRWRISSRWSPSPVPTATSTRSGATTIDGAQLSSAVLPLTGRPAPTRSRTASVSDDGHPVEGTVSFELAAPAVARYPTAHPGHDGERDPDRRPDPARPVGNGAGREHGHLRRGCRRLVHRRRGWSVWQWLMVALFLVLAFLATLGRAQADGNAAAGRARTSPAHRSPDSCRTGERLTARAAAPPRSARPTWTTASRPRPNRSSPGAPDAAVGAPRTRNRGPTSAPPGSSGTVAAATSDRAPAAGELPSSAVARRDSTTNRPAPSSGWATAVADQPGWASRQAARDPAARNRRSSSTANSPDRELGLAVGAHRGVVAVQSEPVIELPGPARGDRRHADDARGGRPLQRRQQARGQRVVAQVVHAHVHLEAVRGELPARAPASPRRC